MFRTLDEALEFLTDKLGAGDVEGVAAICEPLPETPENPALAQVRRKSRAWAIEGLAEAHREQDLRLRYAGLEFPIGDEFKLGGHASELGHTHVDFERCAEGWRLKDVWVCR